ncbi:MAG: hypothetical protein AAF485_23950, partial [Chloroflexota bacterium]
VPVAKMKLSLIVGLIQWTSQTPASQGRLLFPGFAAIAPLWAIGWMALTPRWGYLWPGWALLALAIWTPWAVIAPAYAPPQSLTTIPTTNIPLETIFDENIQLLGYEADHSGIQPGQALPLTLYWANQALIERDYTIFIHLVDEQGFIIAQRDLFHGPGVYPTSQWSANEQFAETYVLNIPHTTFSPTQAHFRVGLYDHQTGSRLITQTGQDHRTFGKIAITTPPEGDTPNPQMLQFEDHITLIGYTIDQRTAKIGETVTLTLYWMGDQSPSQNYKVFVHAVADGDIRAAQHDSDPQGGLAPTSSWQAGQIISDEHPLTINPDTPPGMYRLLVGLYHPETGQRVRLIEQQGGSVLADSITLSGINIQPD